MSANKMACFGAPLPNGYYVRWEDYDALAAEIEGYKMQTEQWKQHFEGAMDDAKWQKNRRIEVQVRIAELEAALRDVETKLAEYLERVLQGRTLPNRWVGEINDIVQAAKPSTLETNVEPERKWENTTAATKGVLDEYWSSKTTKVCTCDRVTQPDQHFPGCPQFNGVTSNRGEKRD